MSYGAVDFFSDERLREAEAVAGVVTQPVARERERAPFRPYREPGPPPEPYVARVWPIERTALLTCALREDTCRWPVGEDTGIMQLYCGRPSTRTYCVRCENERELGKPGKAISVPE